MKTIFKITTATIFAAGLFSLATPASAVEAGEAMKACRARPSSCQVSGVSGKGDLVIVTNDDDGGVHVIDCPLTGPCKLRPSHRTSTGNGGEGYNAQIQETGRGETIQ